MTSLAPIILVDYKSSKYSSRESVTIAVAAGAS